MVLEWTPEEASLQPFSSAASAYISREAWETQNHQTFCSICSLLGTRDRMSLVPTTSTAACALLETLHDRPTSEESLRDSEPPSGHFLTGHPSTKGKRLHEV